MTDDRPPHRQTRLRRIETAPGELDLYQPIGVIACDRAENHTDTVETVPFDPR